MQCIYIVANHDKTGFQAIAGVENMWKSDNPFRVGECLLSAGGAA